MDPQKLLLTVAAWLLAGAAEAGIYQWEDESGTHFGDRPPADSPARSIESDTPEREQLRIRYYREEGPFPDETREQVDQGIAEIHRRLTGDFGLDVRGTVEVNVHLVTHRTDFRDWVAQRTQGHAGSLAGVFITASNEVGVWNHGRDTEPLVATLLHEATHVMLHQMAPETPLWLHEGLAQYFEGLRPDGQGGMEIRPLPAAIERIRQWVEDGTLITLRDYLHIPENRWREMAHNQDAVPYTLAWAIVYFLMSHPSGESTLRRALHELEKTGTRPDIERLERFYPGGMQRMEHRFFEWARQV